MTCKYISLIIKIILKGGQIFLYKTKNALAKKVLIYLLYEKKNII